MKINLPNKLTILRMLMIPVLIVLFFVEFPWHTLVAAVVYVLACLTDFLDGHIARKYNLVTNFGKFLDPIADKAIVACALIAVCVTSPVVEPQTAFIVCVAVFTMVILSRELIISGFRIVAADKNVVLAADKLGKIKTVFQMTAIFLLLPVTDIYAAHSLCGTVFYYVGFSLLGIATLLTVISGAHYIIKNKSVLEG